MPGEWAFSDYHLAGFLIGIFDKNHLISFFFFYCITSRITISQSRFYNRNGFIKLALVDDNRVTGAKVLETYFSLGKEFFYFRKNFTPGAVVLDNNGLSLTLTKLGRSSRGFTKFTLLSH